MFGNLGCHLMHFPSGRYGYVGTIPTVLGEQMPASTSAVLGGRAFTNLEGALVEWKFPTFATADEARAHAAKCRVALIED